MLETRVVSDGVEGICVYFHGECHHERVQVKSSRRQSDAPGEEGEEIKSPKRKLIRLESEEMQDYERNKGHGSRGSGRIEFRTECDQCSAEAFVPL